MLGAAGAIAPETLGKLGMRPAETALPWFKTGAIPSAGTCAYWADPYTLFVAGDGAHGVCGAQEKGLGGSGDPAYPGGPFFNPLGFGKDDKSSLKDLKLKEVKNGTLAMLAIHTGVLWAGGGLSPGLGHLRTCWITWLIQCTTTS
ncbi:unnamed protein product [Musa hybrid cultivar]